MHYNHTPVYPSINAPLVALDNGYSGVVMAHNLVIGGSGTGKSSLIKQMILEDINDGFGVCFIDPEHCAPALNLFAEQESEKQIATAIELYEYIFSSLDAEMTSKQQTAYRFVSRLLMTVPKANIHTMREVLEPKGSFKYQKYVDELGETAKSFFANEFESKQFAETKQQILRRLYTVLENQTMEKMLGATESKLNVGEALDSGKVVLVSTAKSFLKQTGASLLGRIFIAQVMQAVMSRGDKRKRTYLYVDECFVAGTPVLTIDGYKPIEQIKKGDLVMSAIGWQSVEKTMSKIATKLIKLKFDDGSELTVTPNHKLFTSTGWEFAGNLSHASIVLGYPMIINIINKYAVCDLQQGAFLREEYDLFEELFSEVTLEEKQRKANKWNSFQLAEKPQSEGARTFGENEKKQSNEKSSNRNEIKQDTQKNWTQTESFRWEWASYAISSESIISVFRQRLLCGTCSNYQYTKRKWLSDLLQNRYCKPKVETSHRSRWHFSWKFKSERSGQKERTVPEKIRVVSIESVEQRSGGEFKENLEVYNLTVKGHPSYVVNNILAHNCQDYAEDSHVLFNLFEQARKYNLGLIVSHQYLGQLPPKLQQSISANTAIKFARGVSAEDARTLAKQMFTTPEFIQNQGKGDFACYLKGQETSSYHVEFGKLERMTEISKISAIHKEMQEQYGIREHLKEPSPTTPPKPKTPIVEEHEEDIEQSKW